MRGADKDAQGRLEFGTGNSGLRAEGKLLTACSAAARARLPMRIPPAPATLSFRALVLNPLFQRKVVKIPICDNQDTEPGKLMSQPGFSISMRAAVFRALAQLQKYADIVASFFHAPTNRYAQA